MSVLLGDVVVAVRHGDAALVGESCGYLVLGAADLALQMPRLAHCETVLLTADGGVELKASPCTFTESEMSLRGLLRQLLRFARTPCPNLMRVAERTAPRGLELFVLELEAALVPVNRRAARRSLSRLAREVSRSGHRANVSAEVEERQSESVRTSFDEQASPSAPVHEESPALASTVDVMSRSPAPAETIFAPSPAPAPIISGRAETATQVLKSSPRADIPNSALARLLLGAFGSESPSPVPHELTACDLTSSDIESPSFECELGETDLFDDLLDECPTQVFGGQLLHEVSAPADMSEVLVDAVPHLTKRTLTPPVPVERMMTPRLPEEEAADLARLCVAPPRHINPTDLVTSPGNDVLILSPCAPVVMELSIVELQTALEAPGELDEQRELEAQGELEAPGVELLADYDASEELHAMDEIEAQQIVEFVPAESQPPETRSQRKSQPFYRPRARSRAPIAAHVSLIPNLVETPDRPPSDIEELLNRRLPSTIPGQELFSNLQTLSRVDLSPNAPLVALVKTR